MRTYWRERQRDEIVSLMRDAESKIPPACRSKCTPGSDPQSMGLFHTGVGGGMRSQLQHGAAPRFDEVLAIGIAEEGDGLIARAV